MTEMHDVRLTDITEHVPAFANFAYGHFIAPGECGHSVLVNLLRLSRNLFRDHLDLADVFMRYPFTEEQSDPAGNIPRGIRREGAPEMKRDGSRATGGQNAISPCQREMPTCTA